MGGAQSCYKALKQRTHVTPGGVRIPYRSDIELRDPFTLHPHLSDHAGK
jgi:hypothetical protein